MLRFHGIGKDEPIPDWLQRDASLITLLFRDGEALYGLNELNGSLYRVDIAQDGAALHGLSRLDFFSDEGQAGLPFVRCGAVCGESLYLLMGLTDGGAQASLSVLTWPPERAARRSAKRCDRDCPLPGRASASSGGPA